MDDCYCSLSEQTLEIRAGEATCAHLQGVRAAGRHTVAQRLGDRKSVV